MDDIRENILIRTRDEIRHIFDQDRYFTAFWDTRVDTPSRDGADTARFEPFGQEEVNISVETTPLAMASFATMICLALSTTSPTSGVMALFANLNHTTNIHLRRMKEFVEETAANVALRLGNDTVTIKCRDPITNQIYCHNPLPT